MKKAGLALIAIGTLVASWAAVVHAEEVRWLYYGLALAAGVAGVALARAGQRSEARHGQKVSGDVQTLVTAIERVVDGIRELDEGKTSLNPYDAHGLIDERFPEPLAEFVEARESLTHAHGLQAYAEVMNAFAAGERYLNRVWSASVDGYVDEVREYLGRARAQFEETRSLLRALEESGGPA